MLTLCGQITTANGVRNMEKVVWCSPHFSGIKYVIIIIVSYYLKPLFYEMLNERKEEDDKECKGAIFDSNS
jgi:hypothetical protein